MKVKKNYILVTWFQGLRPPIPKHTHPKLVELLERCWQHDPGLRPDFSEIIDILKSLAKEVSYINKFVHKISSIYYFLCKMHGFIANKSRKALADLIWG